MEPLIDQNLLHQVTDSHEFDTESIIAIRNIDMLNLKGKTTSKTICITEFNLHVFKKKSVFRKAHAVSKSYPWFKLLSISVPEPKSFILTYPDAMLRFIDQDTAALIEAIVSHLRDVRIAGDMPKLQFDHSILHIALPTNTDNLMEKRLRFQAYVQDKKLPPGFFTTVAKYTNRIRLFEDKDATFDFRNLMSYPHAFDVILYALIGEKNINSIILPQTQQRNWTSLGLLMKHNNFITEIETMEQPDETTKQFVDNLISNKNTQLSSLRFRRASYDETFVSYLTSLIQHIPNICEIAIEDALSTSGLTAFIDNFETCAEYNRIVVLSLRETPGIDIGKLVSLASNLRSLDLCRCEIDISKALKEFKMCDLEILNLSENKSVELLSTDIILSPTINKILVSGVTWTSKNFFNFLKVLEISQKNSDVGSLYLDISSIRISDAPDCQQSVASMRNISFPYLSTLIFNGNPINKDFFEFLANCSSIHSLSITDCFLTNSPIYNQFLTYINKNLTLTELIIRSTKEPFSQVMTKTLFDCLKQNHSIAILDFQDQHQGSHLFELLKELIETNMTIREIRFDNNSMPSLTVLETLGNVAAKRANPLKLHIPKHDILDLVYTAKFSDEMVDKQVQMIRRISKNPGQSLTVTSTGEVGVPVPSIPLSNRKTVASFRVAGRRTASDASQAAGASDASKKRTNSCAEQFDFSAIKKKFVEDAEWIETLNCVPMRDSEQIVQGINNDLTLDAINANILSQ